MATYTKETALYDTGAIASDIEEAGKTADRYITAVDQSGIKVHAQNNPNINYSKIDANGLEVFKGTTTANSTSVAKFGDTARVGKANYGHVEIDDTGMVVKGNQDGSALSGSDEHSYIASTAAFIGAESNLAHIDMGGARSLIYSTQSGQTVGDRYHGTEIITDTEGAYFTADYATTSIQARKQNKLANVTVDIDASNASHINMVADSIQMNGNSIADFVTSQGISGIWAYRVWNSGIKECWGAYTASIAVTTSSPGYGGYRSGSLNIPAFPVTFTSAPTVTATVGSAGGVWVNNVHTITTTGGSFYLSAGASSAATNRTIYFHVMGK